MQEYFDNLVKNYPWATEEALDMLNSELTEGNMTMAKVAAIIGDGSKAVAVSKVKDKSKTAKQKTEDTQKRVDGHIKEAGAISKQLMSNAQPANAIAEISHEIAKLAYNAGASVGNFMGPAIGKVGKAAQGLTKFGGKALVATTGIGVIYAKLLTEQDKYARQLINYGSIVSDVDMYTTLRSSVRNLGMGFKKYADITESALPFITASEGDVFRGQVMLAEFLEDVNNNENFTDFGMTIQQQSQFLAQEAETLYQLGELDKMNDKGNDILVNSFKSANKLGLFLADTLGQSRMETLRQREEARNTEGIQVGLLQNAQFLNEHFGNEAAANIQAAVGYYKPLMNATLGEEFAEAFQKSTEGTLGDIQFDQDAANNIPREFLEKLNAVGPGVAQMFTKMVEDTATGKLGNEADAVKRQQEFVALIRKQIPKLAANSEILNWANGIVATARVVPESFDMADLAKIRSDTFYKEQTELADSTIDTLDNFSVTFQNMQEILVPGFGTMGGSAKAITKSLMRFGKAVSGMFGGSDRFDKIYNEQVAEVMTGALAQVTEKNIDATILASSQNIDEYERQKTEVEELIKKKEADGEYTEEDQQIAKQQLRTLDEQLKLHRDYLAKLIDKNKEFAQKEAEVFNENGAT